MGKIITIVGNLGAGKTTLARLLCAQGGFTPCWEKPEERPFQAAFTADPPRWALTNQLDFFLFRCQQEAQARQRDEITVFDGGFDQDYHVFTHLLFTRGYLHPDELDVCTRFYDLARSLLPPPDLIIFLAVDIPTLLARRATRQRDTVDQSFDPQEFHAIQGLLEEWLRNQSASPVIRFTFQAEHLAAPGQLASLLEQIRACMAG